MIYSWSPHLDNLRIPDKTRFYFQPIKTTLFDRAQKPFFDLSVFGYEGQLYLSWKTQKDFEEYLIRSGIHTKLPVQRHTFTAAIGFCLPSDQYYPALSGPWLRPVLLDLVELPPFQDSTTDWFQAVSQGNKILIEKALGIHPLADQIDKEEIELQLMLDTQNFPRLDTVFHQPTLDIVSRAYGLDLNQKRVPANLLPR